MSDLFQIHESPLPPLEAARRRLAKAWEQIDKQPVNVPRELAEEALAASKELTRLEQEAMRK